MVNDKTPIKKSRKKTDKLVEDTLSLSAHTSEETIHSEDLEEDREDTFDDINGAPSLEGDNDRYATKDFIYPEANQRGIGELFKIVLICLFDIFTKYVHSEHRNLRLVVRLILNALFVIMILSFFSTTFEQWVAPSLRKIPEFHNETLARESTLSQEIKVLQNQVHVYKKQSQEDTLALKGDIDQLKKVINSLNTRIIPPTPHNDQRLETAIIALRDHIEKGIIFDNELNTLQSIGVKMPLLQTILNKMQPYALIKTYTLDELSNDLVLLKTQLMNKNTNTSLWGTLWYKIKSLVNLQTHHDKHPVQALESYAVLSTCIDAALPLLTDNKLTDAITLMKNLPEDCKTITTEWLSKAEQTLILNACLDQLNAFLTSHNTDLLHTSS